MEEADCRDEDMSSALSPVQSAVSPFVGLAHSSSNILNDRVPKITTIYLAVHVSECQFKRNEAYCIYITTGFEYAKRAGDTLTLQYVLKWLEFIKVGVGKILTSKL